MSSKRWSIEYFKKNNGRSPIKDFIDSVDLKSQAKLR